ncbi:CtsR family transcriptional regulator [Streptococcus sp. E17BB]|uniref:CtsR family transcriptional regulator n=1 Tax=Streptococcus sp. E17BB TaxID=3278714 RepID=UPI00359E8E0D
MPLKNTSDHIEEYIKEILERTGMAEIKRSHIADTFRVVPSQINYVLKTRFTESRGYLVESKRGGGGYIRIARLTFSDQHHLLCNLMESIGDQLSEQIFAELLDYLSDENLITRREGQLVLSLATDDLLGTEGSRLRAEMLRRLLQRLDRKG